ncbi:VWA domain-containing protein [Baia soyae]|uniref:D-amino-acid dehydrogenase/Ca-activated chloride channel family protein n=1 Tax=Baia soyae TaxID=1544746 RepID=A0A4R2RXJ0_9BACL|nr:VWA domain-containing protein [Baia soyae]TCP69235.1 D-amino-acid dehydrogenase/Ca-activated chloride channel family protein [Baia soyae]
MLKKSVLACISMFLLVLSACSIKETPAKESKQENDIKPTTKELATDLDGYLKEGPGKYAGVKYDETKVKSELDKLPNDISVKDAQKAIIDLLAEDYQPVLKEIDNFNTTLHIDVVDPENQATDIPNEKQKPVNAYILLDSSGSMVGKVGGRTKMDLAKAAVNRFSSSLPKGVNVSLRVYGNKGSSADKDKDVSCKSTEEVYPLTAYDSQKFGQSLNQFKPTGWTPIGLALTQAKKDLEEKGADTENIVYVVSDGIETCGGDPVQAAKELNQSGAKAIVNIIGFDVDNAGQQALKKVAEAGGGEYSTVQSEKDLREYFDKKNRDMYWKWNSWGTKASLSLHSQRLSRKGESEKLLFSVSSGFWKLMKSEEKNMKMAREYLKEKGKISEKSRLDMGQIFLKRYIALADYKDKKWSEINQEIDRNFAELNESAERKEKEMKGKYGK